MPAIVCRTIVRSQNVNVEEIETNVLVFEALVERHRARRARRPPGIVLRFALQNVLVGKRSELLYASKFGCVTDDG